VLSRDHRIVPSEQRSAVLEYPPVIRDRYLQLPQHSDRIAELAHRVTDGILTPYEQATAVLEHLLSNYIYSLEANTESSSHPIEEFLFTRKTGYCEHYATAMVLMLRSIGIPSRLVTGFLATEWNDFGNYYTVRQRDAHAWVEVYYPQSGWITMDPTPPNPTPLAPTVFVAFQRFAESVRLHWDRAFIRYSGRDQIAFVHSLRDGSDSARRAMAEWAPALGAVCAQFMRSLVDRTQTLHRSIGWTLMLGLAVVITSLILLILNRWPYGRRTEGPQARTHQQIVQLYRKMLELFARRGIRISSSTTPMEILQLVSERWAAAEATAVRLTTLYCRARFGVDSVSSEELTQAVDDLAVLKRLARTSP
jgi:hypothetical protein